MKERPDVWPIYVPSRGRAGTSKFLARVREERLATTIVVEPREAAVYREAYPGLAVVVLPENDRGLTFSRNFLLEEARRQAHPWIWQIDDDVSGFLRFEGTKGEKVSAKEALAGAQVHGVTGISMVALEYQQFAWSAGARVKENGYCDVVVGLRPRIPFSYRDVPLKEDRDFAMQVVSKGYETRRVTRFAFAAPGVGSNPGGLHEQYAVGKDVVGARRLVELWPWCSEVVVKNGGRVDAKIHWRRIRARPPGSESPPGAISPP